MKRETRKLSELKNWDKNPRSIKKEDFKRLKTQIKKLGQYKPLLITDDGTVLGGNMRLKAYQELGIDKVWVSVVDAPTDEFKIKYALSDNDRAGYYKEDKLAELILSIPDIDLGDYKLDLGKLTSVDDLLKQFAPDEVVEDEAPPVPEEAESKLGEVYELGRHRLMVGDSTKIEDVEKLMGGNKADMVFTDPPYGVSYQSSSKARIQGDHTQVTIPLSFKHAIERATNNNARQYWCGANKNSPMYFALFDSYCNSVCSQIIWVKESLNLMHYNYHSQFEVIFFGWKGKGGGKDTWFGDRKDSDVWDFRRDNRKDYLHPTQKPVELSAKALKNSCPPKNGICYDPFGGSGSTLIACEQTNRTCFMMEISEKYCDVIRQRYNNFIMK